MSIDAARWRDAQASEQRYWDDIDLCELLRVAAEKPAFLAPLGAPRLSALFDGKDVLEIGCGPLGLSLVSFYAHKDRVRRLTKLEPLPRAPVSGTAAARVSWAKPFVDWVSGLTDEGTYVQAAGEALAERAAYDTVVTYNVLDHVRDPGAILANAREALRPDGRLLVGVDCLSVMGRLRFEHLTRRTARGSILVEAHPHSFVIGHVQALIVRAGFADLETFGAPSGLKRWLGGAQRPAFLARKSA